MGLRRVRSIQSRRVVRPFRQLPHRRRGVERLDLMQSRLERRGVFGARGAFRLVKPIEDVRSGAKSEFWPRLRIGLGFGFRLGLGLGFLRLRLLGRLRGSLRRALGRGPSANVSTWPPWGSCGVS